MTYMKDAFIDWISNQKRADGTEYSRETISSYVSSLRTHASKLNDIHIEEPDLFYIDDLDSFNSLMERIKESKDYSEINKAYHRVFSSALSIYRKFLEAVESETGNLEEGFEKWLESYPDHKYSSNTIKRYIRALNKAEEWLEIKLENTILEISDFHEYLMLETKIKKLPNYDEVNQKHGHGDLSAAMSLYKKFLKDRNTIQDSDWWPSEEEDHPEFTEEDWQEMDDIPVNEAIARIKSYIASKGFTYEDGLIENFYLSLKSKPFVILAGISGTGKTRLVKLFAEAIKAEYKMVSVRPDWSDSSDLFGHTDLNGEFKAGAILDFIAAAVHNPNRPYILCLDEMNLARVEYYLSEILSVIETRDYVDGRIVSDPLVRFDDEKVRQKYGEITFVPNLYIVGTVNMDETTFPFSKKVLDRANTIEFNQVDLRLSDLIPEEQAQLNLPNSFLMTEYLFLVQCRDDNEFVDEICGELQKLNEILEKANAHVGYRVRDEIVFYMLNNRKTGLLTQDQAFDNEIMQKILPRIQGSSAAVKEMLCKLFKEFAGDYQGQSVNSGNLADNMLDKIKKDGARYPKSAKKVAFMVRRFEEDGFTSYWL